jgi:ATP-binding cassette subfamily B protein
MTANADLGTRMTERFNVAGALLVKLLGRPSGRSASMPRAKLVRDTGVKIAMNRTVFMVAIPRRCPRYRDGYGVGGLLAVNGALTVGTLLALAALLARLWSADGAVQRGST